MARPKNVAFLLLAAALQVIISESLYTPTDTACPGIDLVRPANGLSAEELEWLEARDSITVGLLRDWVMASDLDFDVQPYFGNSSKKPIRVGMALSGGGYRAMLSGAGMIAAFDSRTDGASEKGHFGGLLQASSYISGLSGGSWLVGSLAMNNWTTVQELQRAPTMWNFQVPFEPTINRRFLSHFEPGWYLNVANDIIGKGAAGFPISVTDVWGRYLSAQLFPGPMYGRNLLWSDLQNYGKIHEMPLPILVCDSLARNVSGTVTYNTTLYEVTPFEFGSWDPTLYAFMNTRYLGSEMSSGDAVAGSCVTGYDNVGFLIGASSTLFNQVVQNTLVRSREIRLLYNELLRAVGGLAYLDVAIVGANPFAGLDWVWDPVKQAKTLSLVDGGEDGENLPLRPLLEAERGVDVIFALDNSADTSNNWPAGLALRATYERQQLPQGNGTVFPFVPESDVFIEESLNERPVFFGCNLDTDGRNPDSAGDDLIPPLIVYLPNTDRSYSSNFSTFKLSFTDLESNESIRNGYNVVTQNNGTLDSSWRTCAACAILLREQQRQGVAPSSKCSACFSKYCYTPNKK